MNCIVTAGPTYESLDEVRRLTNFSTGRLGSELARFLVSHGHNVTLLRGYYAVHREEIGAGQIVTFTTTADLSQRLQSYSASSIDAVFHAAAVSDFRFGKAFARSATGDLTEVRAAKLSTRQGPLLVELVPTPKIITELRNWFSHARLVGWKFEVDGTRSDALQTGRAQIALNRTDACVVNGRAYGAGFGLVTPDGEWRHVEGRGELYELLLGLVDGKRSG